MIWMCERKKSNQERVFNMSLNFNRKKGVLFNRPVLDLSFNSPLHSSLNGVFGKIDRKTDKTNVNSKMHMQH